MEKRSHEVRRFSAQAVGRLLFSNGMVRIRNLIWRRNFESFTQRVTKEPTWVDWILNQGETELFNVRAKTLVDQFGNDIVDSKGNKIWFPESFDPADAIGFGKSIAALPSPLRGLVMYYNFRQGGPRELQRTYNGQSNGPFAEAFTRAASYALGLTGAAAGYSQEDLMNGGGLYNLGRISRPPTETRAIIQKMYRSSRKVFGTSSPLCLHRRPRFQLVHSA